MNKARLAVFLILLTIVSWLIWLNIEYDKNLKECERKIGELKEGEILMKPSLKELIKFLQEDKTDEMNWSEEFDCNEFTNTFIRNFADKGYFSCAVALDFEGMSAHALVAVETREGLLLYIEPQDDFIIESLEIGDNYCEKVNWNCELIIKKISSCFEIKVKGNETEEEELSP